MERSTYLRKKFSLPAFGFILLALIWCASGCTEAEEHHEEDTHAEHAEHNHAGEEHEGEEHGEEHHDEEGGIIEVNQTMLSEGNIKVGIVDRTGIRERIKLPAVVAAHGDGLARVGTIIPGRVAKLYAGEGAYVAKGTILAEIETMEIGKVRAEYLDAVAREKRASQAHNRQQRLAGDGVGAQRTLEEATAELEQVTAQRKEAEAHLKSLGIDPNKAGSSFANYLTIRAPIAGVVSQRTATLGEHINPDDDMFTLLNTGKVWIDAQGTPKQAASLAVGGRAIAITPSGEEIQGTISFISPTVDPESKSVKIRMEIPNRNGSLRPGAFVTAEFESGSNTNLFVVPTEAVETEGNRFFVYRVHEPGKFERVEVDVQENRDRSAIIRSGLDDGDQIAFSGIFYLRSIRMQGELSEHHH